MSTRIHTPDIESDSDEQTETTTADQCPDCAGELTPRGGETICADCGLVVAEYRIDHGPEWRSYTDAGQEQERTGAPLTETRHDRGLSTEIGRWTDGNGNRLSSKKRRQLGRLRQAQHRGRFRSKAERILAHGLADIRRITSALGLPDYVRDRACSLFRHAQREGLLRGRSIEGLTSASVYAICRCSGLPWTLNEVADVTCISQSKLAARYRKLNVELGLPAQPPSPSAFVPRLAAEFDVTDETRKRACELAEAAEEAGVTTGVDPAGFASACLYKAGPETGPWRTQVALADAAGIVAPTLRDHRDTLDELAMCE